MNSALFLSLIVFVGWTAVDCERAPNAAIDKRFKLTNFAKLKRVLRRIGPREQPYALPRQPILHTDHSGEQDILNAQSSRQRGSGASSSSLEHRISTNERRERVKSGRTGASHRKDDVAVTRTTTVIPPIVTLRRRNSTTTSRPAWSRVPFVIASSSGESRQTPSGFGRTPANGVVEKHFGFHTLSVGTTAFRRKILRMIVEQSLARKANASKPISPEVVHVSGVYTDPNNHQTSVPEQRRKLLPGYPRSSLGSASHENRIVVAVPPVSSREQSRGSDEAFEPVFQVQPATRIHEDSNELLTTTQALRRVEIQRPTTVIIHRKPPHAPPVFLRPTTTTVTPTETTTEYLQPPPTDAEYFESTTTTEGEDEEEVTLSPYARSKLLRYAHRQRKRRVRQDDSIPAKFLQESLACRYCYVYWKRQEIQPRDIFTFCCRSKYRH